MVQAIRYVLDLRFIYVDIKGWGCRGEKSKYSRNHSAEGSRKGREGEMGVDGSDWKFILVDCESLKQAFQAFFITQ